MKMLKLKLDCTFERKSSLMMSRKEMKFKIGFELLKSTPFCEPDEHRRRIYLLRLLASSREGKRSRSRQKRVYLSSVYLFVAAMSECS